MFKKRIYALCAVVGIVAGSAGAIFDSPQRTVSVPFTDVPAETWYYPYVGYLTSHGVVKGVTETEFVPSGNVTVAETAALITRYLGLENAAAERKRSMELLGVSGCNLWFAGYIQLMHEAGIIDVTQYGCTVNGRSVAIVDSSFLQMPVKRYEFATFITRSFELDGTMILTGNGTNGNEFIYGGYYDESMLSAFIPYINDYSQVPASYNYYVLKAYYNGLFNGDNFGNFNPLSNLTRAEMSKVITTVIDKSQRTRIEIPDTTPVLAGYPLSDDSFTVCKGVKYLKNSVSDSILTNEVASCVAVASDINGLAIGYTPSNYYPQGYSVTVHHYRKQPSGFSREITTLNDTGSYYNYMINGDVLIFTLKETSTGRTVDAYEIKLNSYGLTENSNCNYMP